MTLAAKLLIGLVVLVSAATALVQWRAGLREAVGMAAYPPEGQVLQVNGVQVHAVIMGSGPDLVLIHGASGNTRDLTFDLAPELAKRYRVIVFDRPGMGYTGHTDPAYSNAWSRASETPAEQAILLQAAAAQLGADRPIVMGHSFGVAVALAWAIERPDNIAALIDVSGVSNPWPGDLDIQYRVIGSPVGGSIIAPLVTAFVTDGYVEQAIEGIFAPQKAPAGYAHAVGAPLTVRRDSFRTNARQVNNVLPIIRAMVSHYADITIPVEIVHGDADTIVPIDVHSIPLSQEILGAHLTILPGIGHMPTHVAMPDVIAAIDRAATRAGLR